MSWLYCRTRDGSRELLAPWSACLTGWACILIPVRQLVWSSARSRWRGLSRRWCTGYGWWGRSLRTKSVREEGYSPSSAVSRWCVVIWWGTCRRNMGGQWRLDGFGQPRPLERNRRRTGWPSRPWYYRGTALFRVVRDARRWVRRCGYTFSTSMSETLWSFKRRETSPTHSAPAATWWSPDVIWTGGALPLPSAPGGRNGSEGGW